MSPVKEEQVRRAMAGDRAARDRLWRAHRRWVAAVLVAHKPRGADLEDLLQEVALAFVAKVGGLKEPSRFRGWLRAVALNVARGAGRRQRPWRRRQRTFEEGPSQIADPKPDLAMERLEAREAVGRALVALETLPPHYREALLMKGVCGLTQKEIAELLGVPVTTVETRLARGRRMLHERLDGCQRAHEMRGPGLIDEE